MFSGSSSSSSISGGLVIQPVGDVALVSGLSSLDPAAGSSAGLLLEKGKRQTERIWSQFMLIKSPLWSLEGINETFDSQMENKPFLCP